MRHTLVGAIAAVRVVSAGKYGRPTSTLTGAALAEAMQVSPGPEIYVATEQLSMPMRDVDI